MRPRAAYNPRMRLAVLCLALLLTACSGGPSPRAPSAAGGEVALFALGLLDTGYRFGGKNPEAGVDCSGMVSYVYGQAAGLRLTGSAADMARRGAAVDLDDAAPGDLLFFNTLGRPRSHVAIYLGDRRFVHAPSSRGRVRIDSLDTAYFAERFEEARRYLD